MTPTERILAALQERNCHPRRAGKGWSAKCPAHEDRRASLSIAEGDDGRALVFCHAGCKVETICVALGLESGALFDQSVVSLSPKPCESRKKPRLQRHDKSTTKETTFATAREAIAHLERGLGPKSQAWVYHDVAGVPVGLIVRWDRTDGKKDIRPVSQHADGWRIGGMPEPRPLYGLPMLANATTVYVTEGEKSADAARSIGLIATTSPHGSQSADKADWQPLAGKEVIILPDNDAPGRQYAQAVAAIVAKLLPAAVVKVVTLPGLPAQGDIADFVAAHGETDVKVLRRQVDALAASTEPMLRAESSDANAKRLIADRGHVIGGLGDALPRIERYQPFPVDSLPEPIRGYVSAGAKAIGCDPSYIALPLLTAVAAAIGNTRQLRLKWGWSAPPIIWTATVGYSGTAKTPGFKLAVRPLKDRQEDAIDAYAEAVREYGSDFARYEKQLAEWKRDKKNHDAPPERPPEPHADRYIVTDITVEALAPLLLQNRRGLLMARDELAGWIGSFDRYSGASKVGADASHWLSMYNADAITVDRKTGQPKTIYVRRAAVCVTGGIQPEILHKALGTVHRQSGLAARLLLSCPPRREKRWTEADIAPEAVRTMRRIFDRLYALQLTTDDDGREGPANVELTPEAKSIWIGWCDAHNKEQAELSGDLSAAWSKLEEIPARLALVVHYVRWAAMDSTLVGENVADADSIVAAIQLTEWFKYEARRVYELLAELPELGERRRLIELIERLGGRITAANLRRYDRRYRESAEAAETALNELVMAGDADWQAVPPGPQGGKPTRECVLRSNVTVSDTSAEPEENEGMRDRDKGDGDEIDDWGTV